MSTTCPILRHSPSQPLACLLGPSSPEARTGLLGVHTILTLSPARKSKGKDNYRM